MSQLFRMLVGAGFTPAFKLKQRIFLSELERGRKARAYEFNANMPRWSEAERP